MEVKGRVYILLLGNGQYYVGSTNDLERRIAQHKAGKVIATKGKLPLEFLYTRAYETLSGARSVEYQLKKKVENIGDIYTVLVGRAIRSER